MLQMKSCERRGQTARKVDGQKEVGGSQTVWPGKRQLHVDAGWMLDHHHTCSVSAFLNGSSCYTTTLHLPPTLMTFLTSMEPKYHLHTILTLQQGVFVPFKDEKPASPECWASLLISCWLCCQLPTQSITRTTGKDVVPESCCSLADFAAFCPGA